MGGRAGFAKLRGVSDGGVKAWGGATKDSALSALLRTAPAVAWSTHEASAFASCINGRLILKPR